MAKSEKASIAEKMEFEAEVSADVNVPLKSVLGPQSVALGCEPCGRFLGIEGKADAKASCAGGTDDPHGETPATRFDFETVKVHKDSKRMTGGARIPQPDDPDQLEAQAKALMERAAAARKAASKT